MAIANGKVYQFQKDLDQVLSNLRSLVIHVLRSRGATEEDLLAHDVSRERILEFLQLQTELQNSPYACEFTYHVLDGIFDRPQDHIHIVPIDGTSSEVVLSSDGYPQIFPTLEETERHLAKTIASDPLCYKTYKSTKGVVEGNISYDDRSYIRFTI
jgi:glycerophosphoryl diester phosphodiesterase